MNSQRTTSLFPDTNLFLHYRPLNEIDWCALLQADTVEIKIAPVVTRELEEKKTLHPSRKIRDRASTALKLLQRYLSETPPRLVRDGVTLDFLVKEPVPEFAASRGLNLQLGDDRLIGTLLLYHEEHADVRWVLATSDFPLTVKATHYEIDFVTPSESLLLPDQPDETEKKLKQVQAELLQYKSREPVLAVRFEGGEDHARFRITRPSGDSEAEIRSKVEEAKQKHPSIHAKSQQSAGASADVNSAISEMTEAIIQGGWPSQKV